MHRRQRSLAHKWAWICWIAAATFLSFFYGTFSASDASYVAQVSTIEPEAPSMPTKSEARIDETIAANISVFPGEANDDIEEYDDDLLTWAAKQRAGSHPSPPPPPRTCIDCFLVVSVKTRAVRGFQTRQLIRSAWAHAAITSSLRTRVVFLGCAPELSPNDDRDAIHDALALEKQTFGDLLTHELGACVDSYFRLVDKVVGFFDWVTRHHASAPYVMMADDDVYVRLDRVVALLQKDTTPRTRYYAGQVPFIQSGRLAVSIRHAWSKNRLSFDEYPLPEHAPRALGAHYLLSFDLVRFLSRNRDALRGMGAIEDLTIGFWLRVLLGVYPVHLRVFDLTLCSICHNTLVSYGELSHTAMRRIHRNLARGDATCRGFTWSSWVAPHAGAIHSYANKLRPRTDVAYAWDFHLASSTRTMRIDFTIAFTDGPLAPLALPTLSFTPSLERGVRFCTKLREAGARLNRRLPLLLCDDLFDRLDDFLRDGRSTTSTALLALARSNRPPLVDVGVTVKVWLSQRVLRWRAFVECLVAEMYEHIHVYVFDEAMVPDPTPPVVADVVVISSDDLADIPPVPPHGRLLVLAAGPTSLVLNDLRRLPHGDNGPILLTQDRVSAAAATPHQMYIPLASLVFGDTLTLSPLALLQASGQQHPTRSSSVETFAVLHCNPRSTALLAQLDAANCSSETHPIVNALGDGTSSPETIFALDAVVTHYAHAKFVLAFESDQTHSDSAAGSIIAAFLAGSVPIYDGDGETVTSLFNPKAFVSCARFASLQDCGAFVAQVHGSPSLYERMRREPPIVNETAFYEVFSWHPDVLRRLKDREEEETVARLSVVARIQDLINSS